MRTQGKDGQVHAQEEPPAHTCLSASGLQAWGGHAPAARAPGLWHSVLQPRGTDTGWGALHPRPPTEDAQLLRHSAGHQ